MTLEQLLDGLNHLNFVNGFAFVVEEETARIDEWTNELSQPTDAEILAAAPHGAYVRERSEIEKLRQATYALEADPLNFEWQATGDELVKASWLAKRDEIKVRYPYPVEPPA